MSKDEKINIPSEQAISIEQDKKSDLTTEQAINSEPDMKIAPSIEQMINDEALRYRIRKLIDEPKPASKTSRFITHQLFIVVISFILSGLIGTGVTYFYNSQQAKLQRERSFADELNKTRVTKTAEVWEKVYAYEAVVESIMEHIKLNEKTELNMPSLKIEPGDELSKAPTAAKNLYGELLNALNRNRFWIGENDYKQIKEYADDTYDYFSPLNTPQEAEEKKRKREQARAKLDEIRKNLLKE